MPLSFTEDKSGNLVLMQNERLIGRLEKIDGFEIVRTKILDDAISNLEVTAKQEGIDMGILSKKQKNQPEEPKPVKETNIFVYAIDGIAVSIAIITWIAGVALATGWMKLLAICMPFYAWYLDIEVFMHHMGWI